MSMPEPFTTLRFVTISKYAEVSGYTAKAIRRKIEEGVWLQNRHYRRAPDNRIMIDVEGVQRWAEGQPGRSNRSRTPSDSSSHTKANAA